MQKFLRIFHLVMVAVVLCVLKEIRSTKEYFFSNDSNVDSIYKKLEKLEIWFMLNVFFTLASVHLTVKFTLLSASCVHFILMVRIPIFFWQLPYGKLQLLLHILCKTMLVLNNDVRKICKDVGSTDELPLELIYIDKYLYDLKAFPFFIFDHCEQAVLLRLDHRDQGNLFTSTETRNV